MRRSETALSGLGRTYLDRGSGPGDQDWDYGTGMGTLNRGRGIGNFLLQGTRGDRARREIQFYIQGMGQERLVVTRTRLPGCLTASISGLQRTGLERELFFSQGSGTFFCRERGYRHEGRRSSTFNGWDRSD
jgi:hypothetical protein